jgi:glycosyltransferase involved in cell wall biosynthesis
VYYNDGEPVVSGFSNGYVSMTGDFVKGQTYYIAVAPQTLKNFTVEFSRKGDSDKYPVKSTSKPVTFKRNYIHDLGTIYTTGFTTDPEQLNADKPCTIYYVPDKKSPFRDYTGDLYAHIWVRSGGADSHGPTWGDNSAKYKFTKVEDNKWSLTLSGSIRSWFGSGTTPIEQIGILVRSADKTKQTADEFINVVDSKYTITMPQGMKHGINYNADGTVTLVLYDRDNQGKRHDFCNLLWDENWWGDSSKPKKPLYYDNNSGCWWITLTNLDPDTAYKFQYQLGYGSNVTVTTFDPYSEVVYDTHNDQWISDNTYPGLFKDYGSIHGGRASGFISSGKMADEYLLHYGASWECIYHNHFTSLHEDDILKSLPSPEEKRIIRQEEGITEKQVVLSVGQFIYRKGYDVLLKSIASFSEEVGVYIIGGQVTAEYKQLVEELKLKNIHFIDFMSKEELINFEYIG